MSEFLWCLGGSVAYVISAFFMFGVFSRWFDEELAIPAGMFWPLAAPAWAVWKLGCVAVSRGEAVGQWMVRRGQAKKLPGARVVK